MNTSQFQLNFLDDDDINQQTKEKLVEYCQDKSVHSILDVTFEEVLKQVLFAIENSEHKSEIKKRLCEEMYDAECMCFVGRLNRLVNCLSGFSNLVVIKLSDAEEIGNIISTIREQYINIDVIKEKVKAEMLERGYAQDIVDQWIEYIE